MVVHVVSTLLPVFAAIALGFFAVRCDWLAARFLDDLNGFVFRIALPAFILATLARTAGIPVSVLPVAGGFFAATAVVIALGWAWMVVVRLERWRRGTFVQAVFRGNLAFIALPILSYALRDEPADHALAVLGRALVLFAPTMVAYNVLAVLLLNRRPDGGAESPGAMLRRTIRQLARNPLLLAALGGIGLAVIPWKLPAAVADALGYLGQIAGPAALVCVGGAIARTRPRDGWRPALVAALLKTAVLPLLAWAAGCSLRLAPDDLLVLMVFAAAPSAAAGYVMAKGMGGDAQLASNAIVLSTVLSAASLGVIIAVFA